MIDVHTHILPGIDDGARNAGTSVAMAEMMADQGAELVVATPHYFCLDNTPEEHRKKAEGAFEALKEAWNSKYNGARELVPVRIGAEIYLAESLQASEKPEFLKIGGSDLMLFEMPFSGYHSWMPRLADLVSGKAGGIPVFAHIDRYLDQLDKDNLAELESIRGAAFQFNSDSFENRRALKYMFSLIKRGFPVFFASDCHGAHHRPPDLGEKLPALEKKIVKKFSEKTYAQICETQRRLLKVPAGR